jgi:predicted TIM-barrel fold metal-dependent hydrolase
MAYATGRTYYDADSHIMELPDFLRDFADPAIRERLPRISFGSGGRSAAGLEEAAARGAQPKEQVDEMVALGDGLIAGPKGYMALGAFNREERKQALDQLGFDRQLVFSTFAAATCFYGDDDLEVRYGGAKAHNRAMAHFCGEDARLMGVGALPLDDPSRSASELEHLIELGLSAAWVPHRPCGGRSPGHLDFDPVWARLAEAGIPFLLHVGGHPLQIHPDWMNTGHPVPTDWLGGGENVRAKDMTSLHHMAETFLGAMVLDGVFERFPKLRGGAIELGAGWVPSMLKRLDWSAEIWRKSEPELRKLERRPSEQIAEQLAFTPYVYEDVGELVDQSHDGLYLFSSDYPHFEGGRNPLGRFAASLERHGEETRERFYATNFARVFGI